MQSLLFLDTICTHSLAIWLLLIEFCSTTNLQPIFDYISMAITLAFTFASESPSAIVSQGTWIHIGPMTVWTANLRATLCFWRVMELSLSSLECKASSLCQLSKPSILPTERHCQLHLNTHRWKCGQYSQENNGFIINQRTIYGCIFGCLTVFFQWIQILYGCGRPSSGNSSTFSLVTCPSGCYGSHYGHHMFVYLFMCYLSCFTEHSKWRECSIYRLQLS